VHIYSIYTHIHTYMYTTKTKTGVNGYDRVYKGQDGRHVKRLHLHT
jgi:hypothetical protein